MSRPEPILYKTREDAFVPERTDQTTSDPTTSWIDWVDTRTAEALDVNNQAVGEAIGDHCAGEIGPLKREIELLRREIVQLRAQNELDELRDQIKTAKNQIPEVPKLVDDLATAQRRLHREVVAVKEKLGELRVDQSQANYRLAE